MKWNLLYKVNSLQKGPAPIRARLRRRRFIASLHSSGKPTPRACIGIALIFKQHAYVPDRKVFQGPSIIALRHHLSSRLSSEKIIATGPSDSSILTEGLAHAWSEARK